LDWLLILPLAEQCREWSFVFMGPVQPDPETQVAVKALTAMPNVHFLGVKRLTELPAYLQHFDVCVMPYRMNDYTKYIYPMKLHESPPSGRPTAGPPTARSEPFADVVSLATGVHEWRLALTRALEPSTSSPERCAGRQAVARAHDWDLLVEPVARTMVERL